MRYSLKYTLLTWVLSLSAATATTINVPDDYSTIQAALNAAVSSDTVLVQPGTYPENIIWPDVNGIKLISAGDSSNTIIDGGGNSSVIYMNPATATIDTTTMIQGFKITNGGNISNGGGIFVNSASPALTQLWITGNTATDVGGGLYIPGGSPTLTNMTVTGNTASSGGGLYIDSGSPTLMEVTVTGNTARSGGGLYIVNSSATLTEVTVTGNTAPGNYSAGGGLYIDSGSPTLTDVTVTGNTARVNGGGLYISSGSPTLTNVTVSSNMVTNYRGGGLYIVNSSATLTEVTVTGNTATDTGGGLYIDSGSPTLTNVTVSGNMVTNYAGGGLYISGGNPALTDVTVTGNTASSGGGGLQISGGSPTLTRITVSRNIGAGLYFSGSSAMLVNVTITGNTSGIYIGGGTPTITGSNIAYHGAGLYNADNTNTIAAASIWWGDSSGPYHPTQNPTGQGDSVNAFVNVTPWLTTPDITAPPIPVQNLATTSTGNDFVSLTWDPSPLGDFAGYKVYYDSDSSGYPYSNLIDIGTDTSYSLTGLSLGTTFYLGVTVYDTDGNESWYSNEVVATTRVMEAQNLDIGNEEDQQHLTIHTPSIKWDYFDSMAELQTHYHVQVSSHEDFSTIDLWDSGEITSDADSIVYAGNTLSDGDTYYLHVKVSAGGFWSDWASLGYRMNSAPTAPSAIHPINNEVVAIPALGITNSTDAEEDAVTYRFDLYEDAGLTTRLDSALSVAPGTDTTSWTVSVTLPDNGQYWWTVIAHDGYESSPAVGPNSFLVNTQNDAPGAFSLLSPSDSTEVATLTPLLDWASALDPDPIDTARYAVYLDTPDPGVQIIEVDTATTYQITTNLTDNTTYYWKVVATDLSGATMGNTGGYYSFRVNTANDLPGDFALLSPPNQGMVTDLTPIFHWEVPTDPDGAAGKNVGKRTPSRSGILDGPVTASISTYRFYISPDSTFTSITPVDLDTNTYTPAVALTEDLVYYWKVEAVDDVGGIKSSARWSFWTNSQNSPPLAFSVVSPTDQAVIDTLRPGFAWYPSDDADLNDELTYALHLGNSVEALAVMYTGVDTTFTLTTDLTDNTTYYWKVVARDLAGATTENTGGYYSFRVNTANDLPGDFALISPTAGAMVVDLTPEFYWEIPTDPDGMAGKNVVKRTPSRSGTPGGFEIASISTYHFYISPDSTFTSVTPVDLDSNTYTPAVDLTEDLVYYWKVEAEDDVGGIKSSARWSFWTNSQNSPPLAFSVASPTDEAVIDTLRPGFAWHPSGDADLNDELTYTLHLGSSMQDQSVVYTGADTAFTVTTDLTDNTTYYWKIVATDLSGATTENTGGYYSFSTNRGNEAPSPVSLITPDSIKVLDLTPQFYWTVATDPDPNDSIYYHLSYALAIDGVVPVHEIYLDTNSVTLENELGDNNAYWWSVNSIDRLGSLTQTDTAIFWTDLFPESPGFFVTVFPTAEAQGMEPMVEFRWQPAIDPDPLDLVNYSLVYATDWADSNTYTWMHDIVDTTVVISLDDNTEYWWIVEANDSDGQVRLGNDGSPLRFVVGSLSIDDLAAIPVEYALHQNYPNPFNPTSTIQYDLPEVTTVTLVVYDILGRVVIKLVDQEMQPGYHRAIWDARDHTGRAMPTGIYIARLTTPGYTKSIKMLLLK